jgi:hypothetical protein
MEMETAAKQELLAEGTAMLDEHALVLRTLGEMCPEQVNHLFVSFEAEMVSDRPSFMTAQIVRSIAGYRELLEKELARQEPSPSNIERPPLFW